MPEPTKEMVRMTQIAFDGMRARTEAAEAQAEEWRLAAGAEAELVAAAQAQAERYREALERAEERSRSPYGHRLAYIDALDEINVIAREALAPDVSQEKTDA